MDHSARQPGSTIQPTTGLWATGLHLIGGLRNWLVGLLRMTEEEQEDAGIYLGDHGYE